MNFPEFKKLVKEISIGKSLPDSIYVHESAIGAVPLSLAELVLRIAGALEIPEEDWKILMLCRRIFFTRGDWR